MSNHDTLNSSQREAVLHTEGPLLILAGAGSGKTRVITQRIAYLVQEKGVPPYRIFAVTFTNKAAAEMKSRVESLIGAAGSSVFIKTFHSASVNILRRNGHAIGIDRNFSIYDMGDQAAVIKEALQDLRLDPKKIKPSAIASKISEIKDRADYISGASIDHMLDESRMENFREIFRLYHEKLHKLNALDFNDLLIMTVRLLRERPDILSELHRLWRYFMIDEYQDTNHAQYLIARYLASATRNICVVGDDDQSIYSWRGADIRNILNFEKDYSRAKVITLGENYRSTTQILEAASAVIRNNSMRKEKNIIAVNGEGELIVHYQAPNDYGEAEFIVNTIVSLKHREPLKNSDFAVFYRTNAQSRVFEELLRRENISYRVVGGLKFYDRKEIKDLIAYLRFIVNPNDIVSFMRIINTPARGIGAATVGKIREKALESGAGEWAVIRDSLLDGKSGKGIEEFRKIIEQCMVMATSVPEHTSLSEMVSAVADISGYRKILEEERSIESVQRLENIDEFINSVYDYETLEPSAGLTQFLQDISLLTTEENPEQAENASESVTLMTVHNAKGLEFPVVFLTGMEEETFPHRFSLDTEAGIEEERRLCYVGITRARERLYITNAELRRSFNEVYYKMPSRFIDEIPAEFIVRQRFEKRESSYTRESGASAGYMSEAQSRRTEETVSPFLKKKEPPETAGSGYKTGDSVLHPKYGRGRIVRQEGAGDNLKLSILFTIGMKVFLEKYTPLERVD
jgi:DNA helicase-2/ATP-dependent DNA helicase PcrA